MYLHLVTKYKHCHYRHFGKKEKDEKKNPSGSNIFKHKGCWHLGVASYLLVHT